MEIDMDEIIHKVNDDITLIQKRNGLTFGTDALLLAAFIRSMPKAIAADFGSGSGIISLLCGKRNKFKHIYAVELQQDFYDIIVRNINDNDASDYITPVNSDIRDLTFECDVVFTNPPYMKTGHGKRNEHEYKYIARHEVHGDINDFCQSASRILKYGGLFYAVYRPDRMIDLLYSLRSNNLEPKRLVNVYSDIYHEPCLILVEAKKGGRCSIFNTQPLIMYDNGELTNELKYIYENGEFSDRYIKK